MSSAAMRIGSWGAVCAVAAGLHASSDSLASDPVSAAERPPCRERLDRRGIAYRRGPIQQGVANPVRVRLPLGGIDYHRQGERRPQREMFMACPLALALDEMGEVLRARDIVAVEHLGIYEYRCIEGTSPCALSQHATATAIDLHELRARGGRSYNVERDWRIDSAGRPTCSGDRPGEKNRMLHEIACRLHDRRLFNVVLTPNYNAEHRNHLHVDLSPGRHFIR